MSHFKLEFLLGIIIETVWHTFSTEYGRGPSSKLTGFISGRPSKCLVSLEYWKVHVGQEDTTANISPNPSGYMFLHAANTDSQYWLADIKGDAAIERGNCLPAWETALQGLIFNFGKIFSLPSSIPLKWDAKWPETICLRSALSSLLLWAQSLKCNTG